MSPTKRTPQSMELLRVKLPTYLNTPARRDDYTEPSPEERYALQNKITDLELLLPACRRSKKLREEGRAAFSLAVLWDNMREYRKAIKHYTAFLKVGGHGDQHPVGHQARRGVVSQGADGR